MGGGCRGGWWQQGRAKLQPTNPCQKPTCATQVYTRCVPATHPPPPTHPGVQGEIADLRAAEAQREKLVGEVVKENRALAEPLAQGCQAGEEGAYTS